MQHRQRSKQLQRMRRLLGGFVFATLLAAFPVAAQERIPGLSSGLTLGAAAISNDDYGVGLSGRVFAEYAPFIHEIAIRLSGGYLRFDDYVEIGKYPFNSRERIILEDTYGALGVVYRFSRGRFVPFATGNVGLYWYQKEDVYPAAGPIIDGVQSSPYTATRQRTGMDFGLNFGGGIEYFFDETLSMSAEVLLHSIQGEVNSEVLDLAVSFRFLPKK
ncbi:MAG: outer membrane beta-barrel protein [Smithellaceae bacterium]